MIFTVNELEKIEQIVQAEEFILLKQFENSETRIQNFSQKYTSVLMLSADKLKHLNKLNDVEAEAIILNLEDGVSPQNKKRALRLCGLFLSKVQKTDKKIIVRVNAFSEGAKEEILFLNQYKPDAIRIPKIETKEEVELALNLIDESIEVHLSIETAQAWLNLKELKINPRVTTFYLGVLDLFADMNLPHELLTPKNPLVSQLLSQFLLISCALGVKPVSFVYQDYKNETEFKEYLELEKNLGFKSKGCVSPTQAKIVNEFFSSDNDAITRAKEIIKVFEYHAKNGITGFSDDKYGFIDEPIYKASLNLVK
jgi:citrate lyase subunit beta / citryl-CoA lyase